MQVEQAASADGAVERAPMLLAENVAGVPEGVVVAVVDTDMVGAQGVVANPQSYWLPVCHAGSDSIWVQMAALAHLNYKKRLA